MGLHFGQRNVMVHDRDENLPAILSKNPPSVPTPAAESLTTSSSWEMNLINCGKGVPLDRETPPVEEPTRWSAQRTETGIGRDRLWAGLLPWRTPTNSLPGFFAGCAWAPLAEASVERTAMMPVRYI
jgi:hypothetical protein